MASNEEAGPSAAGAGEAGSSSSSANINRPPPPDPEALAAKLLDEKSDYQTKATAAQDFKELLEIYHNSNYAHYVKHMLPASLKALSTVPCSMQTDAPEQVSARVYEGSIHD
jgi:transformation/transcription domain-associated protein